MAKANTNYQAVFPSGESLQRSSSISNYAWAWRVYNDAGQTVASGFSKSRGAAESQLRYGTRGGYKGELAAAVKIEGTSVSIRKENLKNRPVRIEVTHVKSGHRSFVETGGNRHARFATRAEAEAEIERRRQELRGHVEAYSFKVTVK